MVVLRRRLKAPAFARRQLQQRAAALARGHANIRMDVKPRGEGNCLGRAASRLARQPVETGNQLSVRRQRHPPLVNDVEQIEVTVMRGIHRPAGRRFLTIGFDRSAGRPAGAAPAAAQAAPSVIVAIERSASVTVECAAVARRMLPHLRSSSEAPQFTTTR